MRKFFERVFNPLAAYVLTVLSWAFFIAASAVFILAVFHVTVPYDCLKLFYLGGISLSVVAYGPV